MSSKEDVQFLALLVHRGYLERVQAEPLLPALKAGEDLDELLGGKLGWEPDRIAKLRRTRAGEAPEIPGYLVGGKLGTGGTADVFQAKEKKSGKQFALKILQVRAARNKRTLKAFVEEGKLLQRLEHPGLCKGYGVARSGETYFTRLELVNGKTLQEFLDEGQAFPEDVALRVTLGSAEVLAYLCEEGIVHRDVKPGNIMLDHTGSVKLIDLGFAAGEATQNELDSAVGTVEYLSPEQAKGGASADIRSDIYSLGVTLFQLVVGRLPFEGDGDQDTLRKHVMESLSSPELKSRGLSPHLHYFIEKMMAKEADVRYQSWEELIGDVRGQVEGRERLDYTKSAKATKTTRRTTGVRKRRGRQR